MYCCGDSYVVHIYRREENDPNQMTGLVEIVGAVEKKPFRDIEELWSILGSARASKNQGKRKKSHIGGRDSA
jgi:hypothetical protein